MRLLKGLEEEVYAGTASGEIVGLSTRVTDDLSGFEREPDSRNIEYVTAPSRCYYSLHDEILQRRRELSDYLASIGDYTLIPGSCMSLPHSQEFQHSTPGNPYHNYIREAYGTTVVTTSTHINLGIEDANELIRAYRLIRMEASLFLALSAASPFLNGAVTGAHSTRWKIFPKTPQDVPLFADHNDYVDWIEARLADGQMFNIRHLWLSIRPNGTKAPHQLERLELRVCDQIDDLRVLLAVTALYEARVLQLLESPSLDPLRVDWLKPSERKTALVELANANELAAAETSLDATLIDWQTGQSLDASTWIRRLIESVEPVAKRAGFDQLLKPLHCLLEHGNPAQQWLRKHAAGETIQQIVSGAVSRKFESPVEHGCAV